MSILDLLQEYLEIQKANAQARGLVRRRILVHKKGKIFPREQWIRPEEAKKKEQKQPNAAKGLQDQIHLRQIKINYWGKQEALARADEKLAWAEGKLVAKALNRIGKAIKLREVLEQELEELIKQRAKFKEPEEKLKQERISTPEEALSAFPIVESKLSGRGIRKAKFVTLKDGTKGVLKNISEKEAGKEVAAYVFAKIIGFDKYVPLTTYRKEDGKIVGSIQLFVDDIDEAKSEQMDRMLRLENIGLQEQIEDGALFDILIAHSDRHYQNMLMRKNGLIAFVDHGFAFEDDILSYFYNEVIGRPLPERHKIILENLIKDKERASNILDKFLPKNSVKEIFERAKNLVKNGKIVWEGR